MYAFDAHGARTQCWILVKWRPHHFHHPVESSRSGLMHISFIATFQTNEPMRQSQAKKEERARARETERESERERENYVCSYQNIWLWSLTEQREMNVSFTRMHMPLLEHTDELKHTKHNKYVSICSAIIPHTQLWQCMLCAHSV